MMGSPQTDQERIVQLEVRVKELEEWQESFSSGIIKAFGAPEPSGTISDGFGSTWGPCPTCQGAMEVVRPGKAQCPKCG